MLSTTEAALARRQGWQLCEVYDLATKRLLRQVLPLEFKVEHTCASATNYVILRAKQGDKLALKALQLIAQGNRA
jgi:hypothetical protein